METRKERAYCPACCTSVELAWTPEPLHEGHANLHDGEMVCLSCGPPCPRGTCPLSGQAHPVMALRLASSGMVDQPLTARMQCAGCAQVTEMQLVDRTTLLCPLCGTVNRWIMLELAGRGWVAIGRLEEAP
jgi:hypothetical protein